MSHRSRVHAVRGLMAGLAVVALAGAAWAGPDWSEIGDAGSLAGAAQTPTGTGSLLAINGALSSSVLLPDFEDMFRIRITDPATFSARILGGEFDAKLYLLTPSGDSALGLLGNAIGPGGENALLLNAATDGSGAAVTAPGIYFLTICGAGDIPVSDGGGIFNIAAAGEISGPDGPGGALQHTAWQGTGQTGTYTVMLTGVGFVPGPGAPGVVALGLTILVIRRSRGLDG